MLESRLGPFMTVPVFFTFFDACRRVCSKTVWVVGAGLAAPHFHNFWGIVESPYSTHVCKHALAAVLAPLGVSSLSVEQ